MIKVIALDIGGVLAYVDEQALSNHEKLLLHSYLNGNELSHSIKQEINEKINGIYQKLYIPIDSSFSTLEFIHKQGYLLSLWTNNRPAIQAWIESSGIQKFLLPNYLCNSCDMPNGVNKPNFKFYHYALKRIHQEPQRILFVDDKIENVRSAQKLGIASFQYQGTLNLEEELKQKIKRLERKSL